MQLELHGVQDLGEDLGLRARLDVWHRLWSSLRTRITPMRINMRAQCGVVQVYQDAIAHMAPFGALDSTSRYAVFVKFEGQVGSDGGGLRREFFVSFGEGMVSSSDTAGPPPPEKEEPAAEQPPSSDMPLVQQEPQLFELSDAEEVRPR